MYLIPIQKAFNTVSQNLTSWLIRARKLIHRAGAATAQLSIN